jgi:hypothetical protein
MASEESRALLQRLVDGVAASVRRQVTAERRGDWIRNAAVVVLALVVLWGAFRMTRWANMPIWKETNSPHNIIADAGTSTGSRLSPGIESPETFGQLPSAASLRTRASIDEGTAKAAKARQRQFLYSVEDVVQLIADAESKRQAFETLAEALLTNEAGKQIAATQRGVPRFVSIVDTRRTPAGRLTQLPQLLETVAGPVRRAEAQSENYMVPTDEQLRVLRGIKEEAGRAQEEYADAVAELSTLSRSAARPEAAASGVNPPPPATKTLRDAVDDYRTGLRSAAIDERERRLAAERKALDDRTTNAEIERLRAVAKAEEERLLAEARATQEAAKAAAEAKKAEEHRRSVMAKARTPHVRQMLAPFIEKGFAQPKAWQGTYLAFERTEGEKPMSLRALRSVKALDEGEDGLESLAWVAGDAQNDRSRWNFGHVRSWSKDTRRYVADVQGLLRELGEVLVEEGMLAE